MWCSSKLQYHLTLVVRRDKTVANVDFDVNEDLKLLRHKCAFHPKFSFSGTPQRLCIRGWKCCLYNVMPTKITDLHFCNGNGKSTLISAAETLTAPGQELCPFSQYAEEDLATTNQTQSVVKGNGSYLFAFKINQKFR